MDFKIDLNANERKLIDELKQFCTLRNVTPRIAGGWVRDKLLGTKSNDLDIALDSMSGYDFAQLFINASTLTHSSMCKINPNPEKSKHLETATLKIENIQVDFSQLRSETYSATRIPTIEVASASVDAHRRDLTINSLFYNIMTGKIEDYTNGLEDLQKRIVRTPLDPRVTFLDDPLRILRVIRFAIRLDFTIDEKIFDALMPADVKMALSQKVSNERIGIEIQKIVNHVDGYKGMLLLVKYGLLDAVFKGSKSGSGILTVNQYITEKFIECVHTDDSVDNDTAYNTSLDFTDKFLKCKYKIDRPLFNLYTCLLHYKGQNIGQQYVNSAIVESNLKWTRNFTKRIEMIEKHCETFVGISLNDYDIMFALRKMKDDWLNIFYLLYIYTENEKFVKMIENVYSKGYHEKLNERPIINGNDIKQLLECEKHKISEYLECFTVYQIIYDCKDESKLIEYVRSHFGLH